MIHNGNNHSLSIGILLFSLLFLMSTFKISESEKEGIGIDKVKVGKEEKRDAQSNKLQCRNIDSIIDCYFSTLC